MSQLPISQLKVQEIDTSKWGDLKEFLDKPMAHSLVYHEGAPAYRVLDCSFFSVISSDREKAIATLRRDLHFIRWMHPRIKVVAFLSKPATLEIVTEPKPDEDADTTMYTDLSGPKPGKRKWAAFCFLFAYEDIFVGGVSYKQLTPKDWKALGLPSAVREGEVGPDISSNVLFQAVAEQEASDFEITWDVPEDGVLKLEESPLDLPGPYETWEESDLEPKLYPKREYVEKPYHDQKLDTLTAAGVTDPARLTGYINLPEVQAAAEKHDLTKPAGRELQEMRKYFGSGSGLYLSTVDFQTAQVNSTPLTEEAQKRILKALNDDAKPKRKRKAKKPAPKQGSWKTR